MSITVLATAFASLAVGLQGCGTKASKPPTAPTVHTTTTTTSPPKSATTRAKHGSELRGDSQGIGLLQRMTDAYKRVPAVVVAGAVGGAPRQFVIVLEDGVAVAEQFSGGTGGTATKLVAPERLPTYALEPGTSCWQRLKPSNPQALTDIGHRFPEITGAATVARPERTSTGWTLKLTSAHINATYSIEAGTLQVRSITATAGTRTITEHVQTLTAVPTLYKPSPTCPS